MLRSLQELQTPNLTSIENDETSSEDKCELFGSFGVIIQTLLGAAALCILIVKRYYEKPKRPWKIWWYDVSKQIIGALFMHLFNLILSSILSDNDTDADACVWYFVTLFLDCTLGAFLCYVFMWLMDGIAKSSDWKFLKNGIYYKEIEIKNKKTYQLIWKIYLSQLAVWLGVNLLSKFILIIMLRICDEFWINIGVFIMTPFKNAKVKLLMVLIVFPLILNGFYFWISDNILKIKKEDLEDNKGTNKIELNEDKHINDKFNNKDGEFSLDSKTPIKGVNANDNGSSYNKTNNSINNNNNEEENKDVNVFNSFDFNNDNNNEVKLDKQSNDL